MTIIRSRVIQTTIRPRNHRSMTYQLRKKPQWHIGHSSSGVVRPVARGGVASWVLHGFHF